MRLSILSISLDRRWVDLSERIRLSMLLLKQIPFINQHGEKYVINPLIGGTC